MMEIVVFMRKVHVILDHPSYMNTNKTEMKMELKPKLITYKVSLQFGYLTRELCT